MGEDKTKTTTTIDINSKILAEFSYLVNVLEKPKKRNDILEELIKSYNDSNRKRALEI